MYAYLVYVGPRLEANGVRSIRICKTLVFRIDYSRFRRSRHACLSVFFEANRLEWVAGESDLYFMKVRGGGGGLLRVQKGNAETKNRREGVRLDYRGTWACAFW